jgi:hypothetical protein
VPRSRQLRAGLGRRGRGPENHGEKNRSPRRRKRTIFHEPATHLPMVRIEPVMHTSAGNGASTARHAGLMSRRYARILRAGGGRVESGHVGWEKPTSGARIAPSQCAAMGQRCFEMFAGFGDRVGRPLALPGEGALSLGRSNMIDRSLGPPESPRVAGCGRRV